MECVEYSRCVEQVGSTDELRTLTSDALRDLTFDNFMLSDRAVGSIRGLFGDFDRSHMAAYHDQRFYLVDPVNQSLSMSWFPVFWQCSDFLETDRPYEPLFEQSRKVGYESGVSLIVHGPVARSFTLACVSNGGARYLKSHLREISRDLLVIAHALGHAYSRLADDTGAKVVLTAREKECLIHAMRGKTAWETSKIMDVRERTVNFHLQNAIMKTGTSTKHQAWLKAAELGLLTFYS